MVKYEIMVWPFHLEYFYGDWNSVGFGKPHCFSARSHLSDFDNWINVVTGGKKSDLGGVVEVDEAENYEVPCSSPGQELWNMKMCFSMGKAISNSLHGAARSGTGPHPFIRYMWEAYTCNMISNRKVAKQQCRTADVVGSWCRRRNISR
jgi:hypothetical protein